MRLGSRLLTALAVLLATASLCAPAQAKPAAASRAQVRVVGGARHFLVYAVERGRKSTLYYIHDHGRPHRLCGSRCGFRSEAGPMVVLHGADGSLWWRDLQTGVSGAVPDSPVLPGTPPAGWTSTGQVVAAAPTGWILARGYVPGTPSTGIAPRDGYFLQTTDGTITPFAAPPSETTPDRASSTLLPWDGGYREGQTFSAYLMSFARPGAYLPLGRSGDLMHCRSASATRVACAEYGDGPSGRQRYQGIRVYDAGGQEVLNVAQRCAVDSYSTGAAPFALLGKGLAWVTANRNGTVWGRYGQDCAAHHLVVRTAAGRIVREPGRYRDEPISALGGVVVGNLTSSRLTNRLVLFSDAHHRRTLIDVSGH